MAYTTIDDPSAYFHTQLFTGNGSTQSITNDANAGDFKPDWLWIKSRGTTHGHALFDSNRGGNARLASEGNQEERTNEGNVTFQTDGFNVTSSHPTTNNNSTNMVAWQWKANGGTTASNSDGSITSTVQADTTAGFSIVTYAGNATADATVGHGLGVTPSLIIQKNRTGAFTWRIMHKDLTSGRTLFFTTDAEDPNGDRTDLTSSTLFTLTGTSNGLNASSNNYVAYCFAEKQGYSKFGSYTGNGSLDGPFVYLGFKPAWVLIKQTSTIQNWILYDNKINPFNEAVTKLSPNLDSAEDSSTGNNDIDMLSNGFKVREDNNDMNESGQNFIYMAFAESPFVSSEGVPTTAR